MGIRLKDGVDPEILRNYGFLTGKEWADKGERCLDGCDYMYGWWHKFAVDTEDPERVAYTSEDYDIPVGHIFIRDDVVNTSFSVEGTYHVDGDELTPLLETLVTMAADGIIEVKGEE